MPELDELDAGRRFLPKMDDAVTSIMWSHMSKRRARAPVGVLPTFLACRHEDLVRLLPDAISPAIEYWLGHAQKPCVVPQ